MKLVREMGFNTYSLVVVYSLLLFSCTSLKNKQLKSKQTQSHQIYRSENIEGVCIYLKLLNDNTFDYQEFIGLSLKETNGIYIERGDSVFLYSTVYGVKFFNEIIADCENASVSPHLFDLTFENEFLLKDSLRNLHFKEKDLILFLDKSGNNRKCK